MKTKPQITILLSVLLCLLIVGTAGAVLPSGNGQTDAAHSVSVVLASDQNQQLSASTDPGQNLSLADTSSHNFGTSAAATVGVLLSAPLGNTAAVYCALGSGVTSGNTGKGVELQPGDREAFPVANSNLIYCITGTATQNVHSVAF